MTDIYGVHVITDENRYLCERFLAAFDEAMQRFGMQMRDMEEAMAHSQRHRHVEVRRFIARRMSVRDDDGRRITYAGIARALGISRGSVQDYVTRGVAA